MRRMLLLAALLTIAGCTNAPQPITPKDLEAIRGEPVDLPRPNLVSSRGARADDSIPIVRQLPKDEPPKRLSLLERRFQGVDSPARRQEERNLYGRADSSPSTVGSGSGGGLPASATSLSPTEPVPTVKIGEGPSAPSVIR